MKNQPQPLSTSPLWLERHEFLDVEVRASEKEDAKTSFGIQINRHFSHNGDPRDFRVELTVRFGNESDAAPSVYSGMLRIAGYFKVHEKFPEEKIKSLIEITASSMLYGACREMLCNITARGSRGMVSLPSLSFIPPKKVAAESISDRVAEEAPAYGAKKPPVKKRLKK
jgi:preprotein translocase subunit SecB